MKGSLLVREILPFYASLFVLLGAALLLDAVPHLPDAVWIGRWLGIPGVLLILGSFGHSLRKRKIIRSGNPVKYLRLHGRMGWTGSLLVLLHAGIHFNAVPRRTVKLCRADHPQTLGIIGNLAPMRHSVPLGILPPMPRSA